ncbi:MAG TPA: isoprenylcysteine carboxylmethyltransferase family protein [Stellaceae bacterium]|nr:isoprenylcysteine carboxylmethyltransferase family protein [Stellaceae bacterium]
MNTAAELSRYLIAAMWLTWLAIWMAASLGVKRTRVPEPWQSAFYNRAPVVIGTAMLVAPQWLPPVLAWRFLSGAGPPALGTALVFAGLALSMWARWHLGRNWSSAVVVKEGHTLTRSGPYRLVRHPIYSGMVLALFATALAIGETRGFIGAGLILFGFVLKLQAEEERMRETFPEYDDYARHTARLIPGVY